MASNMNTFTFSQCDVYLQDYRKNRTYKFMLKDPDDLVFENTNGKDVYLVISSDL